MAQFIFTNKSLTAVQKKIIILDIFERIKKRNPSFNN